MWRTGAYGQGLPSSFRRSLHDHRRTKRLCATGLRWLRRQGRRVRSLRRRRRGLRDLGGAAGFCVSQRVNRTPPLPNYNRFRFLDIEDFEESNGNALIRSCDSKDDCKDVPPSKKARLRKWERKLPRRYVISAIPSQNSIELPVQVQTTDTGEVLNPKALLDCGATGQFIDRDYVKENRLTTRTLSRPIPIYNVDGTLNEAGSIREVVDLVLNYKGHTERTQFVVTSLGRQRMILGFSWLREHNPEVDWVSGEVKMSRCPARCRTCHEEVRHEKKVRSKESERIRTCREGAFPKPTIEEVDDEDEDDEDELLEEGDRVFMTVLEPEAEHVRASSNISQRLAEAFHRNNASKQSSFHHAVPDYLQEFEDVFSKASFDTLPDRKPWDHAIELIPDAKTSYCKVYPLSPNEQVELDEFLQENLATGRIRPSKSPMASPVFFIKKKDGSLQLVQDYRNLNANTVKNRYPLPLISELVNRLKGARYFTKLDVRWGFNNVRMKEGDEWKVAFRTNRGLFEPLVMFFGLTNSPATFQTMMNEIFHDLILEGVVCVYIDDILIYTKTREEHRRITRIVLERLREHNLYLKHEKCEFEQEKVEYLGLIISHDKVEMDPVKVEGVRQWPVPKNRKEVQSFLGFTNFYCRFIEGFSHHARPLFDLTKKAKAWQWGEAEQTAFDKLRNRITSTPMLLAPDDSKPFQIESDSSDFATGAVLSQESSEDGKWHPVAFLSKSLSAIEHNYDIHDKEMLAIVRALEEWRHFLKGARHKFEIWTDHKNLEYFMAEKKLNRRQARWSLYLAWFDFALHHRPGKSMGKADALSRRADHGDGGGDNDNIVLLRAEMFAVRALEGVTFEGVEREVVRDIRRGIREEKYDDATSTAVQELLRMKAKSLRSAEWRKADGLLYFRDRLYVPNDPELRRQIVEQHHDSKLAGHPGRWKTLELVSRSYWWPQMSRYIGQYCKTCDMCLRTKIQHRLPLGELHPLPIPEERWQVMTVDFIVELPDSHGHDAIMVVVDTVGKRAHFIPTHTTVTALGAARLYLHNVWKLHGLSESVVSDRGPQFVAEFMRELSRLLGIKIAASTAYHPQTDGQTERVNQEVEQYLRIFTGERQDDWDELPPLAEFGYNNHVHSSTQQTPFMLDTGRHPRMGFKPARRAAKVEAANEFVDRMKGTLEEAKSALGKAKDEMAQYYNRHRTPAPKFEAGDKVYLDGSDIRTTRPSRKLSHRYLGPFEVVRPVGTHAYRLRLPWSM